MSTFSTTVTKAQRNAVDYDTRGRAISICSRQHTRRSGYNPSPYASKVVVKKEEPWSLGKALREKVLGPSKQEAAHAKLQVRPTTKRGQKKEAPTTKTVALPITPIGEFLKTTCELATPRNMFTTIYIMTEGKPCIGCSYDEHSKTGCQAKRELLIKKGLWK